ncbi:MAG: hypothetical protein ACJAYU_001704 [Bradymonadia bacterium]|jgi:hypothetical protein
MIRLDRIVTRPEPLEDVFAYVAEFANVAVWDPGVVSCRKTTAGATGVGTEYHVVAKFMGADAPMGYRVTQWDPPNVVELEGIALVVRATDRISFRANESGGTEIRYEAEFTFKAASRIADRLLRRVFETVGDKAMTGLEAAQIPRS